MCPRLPVLRCIPGSSDDNHQAYLPDEIITHIVSTVSPTELVALGWIGINSGFDRIVTDHLKSCTSIKICEDFIWQLLQPHLLVGKQLCRSYRSLIRLIMARYFCYIRDLEIPVALFTQMHLILEERSEYNSPVAMPALERISVQIGEEWGQLNAAHIFDDMKVCKLFCSRLQEVNLDVKLSDSDAVTSCGFRSLVRYLLEVSDNETVWNVTLEDYTSSGQGYHGPADYGRSRDKVFISYVRTLIDLGVTVNRLTLLDKRKVSPYMMVMCQSKRRSIYMYPEFKRCRELFVCYDVGLIAPIFAHENDRFTLLRVFEVDESHVLYKRDLLEYLSNAPNLCEMRVVVPATWSRRVSTCTKGCFTNPDFACFRPDGWCAVPTKLPSTKFALVGSNFVLPSNVDERQMSARMITV